MPNVLLFLTVTALFTTFLGFNPGNHYTLAQNAVSIPPGASNPSASEFYVPPEITVSVGTAVTWTNDDATIHTVTDKGGSFDSSIIAPGATWEHTFDTAGEFDYYCTLHPFMTGKVIVN
jgi:plastocyanin